MYSINTRGVTNERVCKSYKSVTKDHEGKSSLRRGALAAVGAVVAVSILLNNQGYRTIAVQEVNGTGIIQNEKQESSNAYAGMHLYSGDDVTVQTASDMTLLLDMDKYVYAEESTHFWLQAEGDSETSKTRIYLDEGSVLNRLDTKLAEGEEYEVDTPNSVMAVRGTVFRLRVYYDSNGIAWTILEVFQGAVHVSLKTLEGEFNGESEVISAGEAVLIRASSDFSEFVVGESGEVKRPIDYKSIPQTTALILVEYIDDGEELCIGKELLMDYTQLQEHKTEEVITEEATCTKEGKKEIRCIVCDEVKETVTIPALSHEVQDEWVCITEADCLNPGLEQKICTRCGEVVETREIEALGHTEGEFVVTTEATCSREGERVQRCTVCNAVLQRETIAALAHSMGDWQITQNASCTLGGSQSRTCLVCGEAETSATAALGHSYGGWTTLKAATCEAEGSQSRTCSVCGNAETAAIAKTQHNYIYEHGIFDRDKMEVLALGTCQDCGSPAEEWHTVREGVDQTFICSCGETIIP